MSNDTKRIVDKAWNFAHVLRDDGLSYMAYTEQITFLLFLKMADEQTKPPYNRPPIVPPELGWPSLLEKDGEELLAHYWRILEELGKKPGMLGAIFKRARPEIQNPAILKRLIVDLIDPEPWMSMDADVKGDIYEGLLAKSAEESPKGAGQYFTPRELIKAIVDVMRPGPDDTVCDPACGTGGFLLAAYDYVVRHYGSQLDPGQKKHLRTSFVKGWELVPATARLGIMNLYLHGINADPCPIVSGVDSLASDPGERFTMVLTNPPFGKKSSIAIVNGEGELQKEDIAYERQDFWVTTKNKQLNFLQHVKTLLKTNGRCAIVVPDNVLFEGGAGETVRRNLLKQFDVHTLLRLPTGIFYAQGVKANVLFFDARPPQEAPWTKKLWVYDLRTNMHFTLKTNPLKRSDLDEFVECFNPDNRYDRKETWSPDNPDGRWRCFDYEEIIKRDKVNLDITWIKDKSLEDSEDLPEPEVLAREIADDLQEAWEQFSFIAHELEK
ncbi:class I SAM-dependent DNA methyltransferase [Desulfofundulus thermocisternus]|uniref:class I SAM-dependent DNA methyltransferase n=1 Tax=Desulfofundulus thermocisternus TaxID=42471 RepID=UPI00217D65EA|nr:class I SAM-dependent DNA methyltransferase [Desulfofundulus thermocisternus]MCS5696952.1 type I restriction-modification system subunit M [Desulfofundulus thermocisternus]